MRGPFCIVAADDPDGALELRVGLRLADALGLQRGDHVRVATDAGATVTGIVTRRDRAGARVRLAGPHDLEAATRLVLRRLPEAPP